MNIKGIDHLVLTVKDIEVTCEFYSSVMCMKVETFGEGRIALKFGNQKINLHQYGKEFEPKAIRPTPGSVDLCFITDTPIEQIVESLEKHWITIVEGPIERTGAMGRIYSVYFRDPDLNLIEVSNYIS